MIVIYENELKEILELIKSLKKVPTEQNAIALGGIPIIDSNGETLGTVEFSRHQPSGPAWGFTPK